MRDLYSTDDVQMPEQPPVVDAAAASASRLAAAAARRQAPAAVARASGITRRQVAAGLVGLSVAIAAALGAWFWATAPQVEAVHVQVAPATVAAIESAVSQPPAPAVVASAPAASVVAPPAAPQIVESLPPVPAEATATTCAFVVDTVNQVHRAAKWSTGSARAWEAFGYQCVASGALQAVDGAYAVPRKVEATKAAPKQIEAKRAPVAKMRVPLVVAPKAAASVNLPPPPAPKPCELTGTVIKPDGQPLAGAPIAIRGRGVSIDATTDAAGHFSATGIDPSARVQVGVRARGYRDADATAFGCSPLLPMRLDKSNPFTSLLDAAHRADSHMHKDP